MPAVFRAFESRNYALYWTGAFLSNVGSWMQNVALGWLVLQLTNSPFWIGFVSFAGLSPSLLLSLFGGVLADRLERRRVLLVTQQAIISDLVPADVLLNAISLTSVQFNLARIAGPALAGVLISVVNTAVC